MPPILFAALQFPFTRLAYVLFPTAVANGIISGSFAFCQFFDFFDFFFDYNRFIFRCLV
jgi:4-hydroxysphinganine ceramide fatty acyl 2-hydroxylase